MRILSIACVLAVVAVTVSSANSGPVVRRANFHIHSAYSQKGIDHLNAPAPPELLDEAAREGLQIIGFSEHAENLNQTEWQALGSLWRGGGADRGSRI